MDEKIKLDEYIWKKRNEMYKEWNRVLPTNELFFDRWEKAKWLDFGEDTTIYDSSVVMGDVRVGKKVWIGPFTMLEAVSGTITIGDFCSISTGVQIYTHDAAMHAVSGGKVEFKKGDVYIGHNTYIGSMTIIKENVSVGNHCVIGANSFVNRNIEDYSIAIGTPARVVGKVVIEKDNVKFKYFDK
ncbi:putative acetyltransferase [Clostridium homopropionicum DSM 5847]|uniref:Putative acetyltransferase n=1 Tax=Clostridium homopropionicum DSM 5847 TaxID=1121318 RepID=A0A0L6ZDH5_9CLOT|nr:acyltransferase [Clostridium homopropionicum]KOA21034.1 putative acetyltransferase [Clostridium homopropionicum DSM 5847]SFF98904.1 Carbonic anhydrase or acetyltransferase, isoleucine patch superfamily [Clostridium homopropionicum]